MTRNTLEKRLGQLEVTDQMPSGLRECVHEFGFSIVNTCMRYGVKRPRDIRTLVQEIWSGARELNQRTTGYDVLDWLLIQSGANISSKTIHRILAEKNMAVVGCTPTKAMVEASMAEVSGFNVACTKEDKHRRRLMAALSTAMRENIGGSL